MPKISSVEAIEILDSRGNPTLEVKVSSDQNLFASASVPSGASTGEHEAIELRDGDKARYGGKGVLKAVSHVNGPIAKLLVGQSVLDQTRLDRMMIEADGTENKSHFGANAILGASLAIARLGALSTSKPLYRYIDNKNAHILPVPMMNIINGGAHADNSLDFQEFMVRPIGAPTAKEAIRWGAEIFHTLKEILKAKKLATSVGDEGGFAPNLQSNEEALDLIIAAIERAGYQPGSQVTLALDCAASEFYNKKTKKYLELSTTEHVDYLEKLTKNYPIDSIEDGMDQNDWEGWQQLNKRLCDRIQIVGDDLFVTNPKFLTKGIELKAANAILIKLNQIGTVTETLEAIQLAQKNFFKTVISHRSGETEDSFIADLSVACSAGQIKTGSLSRTDRVVKYNRLLAIESELGEEAVYAGTLK